MEIPTKKNKIKYPVSFSIHKDGYKTVDIFDYRFKNLVDMYYRQ